VFVPTTPNPTTGFFELFDSVGKNLIKASAALVEFFESFEDMAAKVKALSDLEHENDLLTHEIIKKLNKTFLTPFDREDLYSLATRMDDILDLMWGAAQRVHLFKLKESTKESVALSRTLAETVELVYKTLTFLRDKKYSFPFSFLPSSGLFSDTWS